MKKFEALERVQNARAEPADGGAAAGTDAATGNGDGQQMLSEEQLLEVFKQTSVFTVKSATAGLEHLHGGARGNGAPRRPSAATSHAHVRSALQTRSFPVACSQDTRCTFG